MKTILWATLSANGNYAQSSTVNPPKQEALADFAVNAKAAGNFIVGRRTFEAMQASGGGGFSGIDIVVISNQLNEIPGVKLVGSPQGALEYLQENGHQTALLAGGADLHNSFLEHGLVDELIFNIAPVLEGKGLNLLIDREHYQHKDVQLVDYKSLGGGVIQLRYAITR